MGKKTKNPEKSIELVKKNGSQNVRAPQRGAPTPSIKPTNVEGHYPRFMLHGAVNLLEEDLRELSIILESFIPHLDKIGIQIPETNSLIKEIVTGTEIFRRLKGISQIELLPFAFKQVPWFTRYTHSCLTYVFGEHVINKLSPKLNLSVIEIEAIKLCFLIHDIGHGPFSHLTERAFKRPRGRLGKIPQEYDHEYWTSVLFKELQDGLFDTNNNPYLPKFSQNNTALKKHNMQIFSKAIEITSNGGKRVFSQLLASQIDIDRLSNYLGDRIVVNAILEESDIKNENTINLLSTTSEVIDNIKRIISNMLVLNKDEKGNSCKPYIAIHEDAVNPVIHYFLDRHIIRYYLLKHYRREAANNLLEKILLRAQHLVRNNKQSDLGKSDLLVETWLKGTHSEAEFIELDDQLVFNQIRKWAKHTKDSILNDLTLRFTAHNFFTAYSCETNGKPKPPDVKLIEKVKEEVISKLGSEYYITYDETTSKPYHTDYDETMIYTENKKIKKLSDYIKETKNELGKTLLNTSFERYLFIVPEEIEL